MTSMPAIFSEESESEDFPITESDRELGVILSQYETKWNTYADALF